MNARVYGIEADKSGPRQDSGLRSTGIKELDTRLAGGFPAGSTVLLHSEPCNAPYLLCEQFAAAGLEEGETVFYYSLERPRREIEDRLAARVHDASRLQIMDFYSVKLHELGDAQLEKLGIQNHVPDVTKAIVPFLIRHRSDGPFRVVFESLTEAIRSYGFQPVSNMVSLLTGIIQGSGGTALLMLERGMFEASMEAEFRHLADGVVDLGEDRTGHDVQTYMAIRKMRGVADSHHLYWYHETEQGIRLEATDRVI